MFVVGVDGCRAGWVAFEVEVPSLITSVNVVDLPAWLRERPLDLACLAIDIPIGPLKVAELKQGNAKAAPSTAWQ